MLSWKRSINIQLKWGTLDTDILEFLTFQTQDGGQSHHVFQWQQLQQILINGWLWFWCLYSPRLQKTSTSRRKWGKWEGRATYVIPRSNGSISPPCPHHFRNINFTSHLPLQSDAHLFRRGLIYQNGFREKIYWHQTLLINAITTTPFPKTREGHLQGHAAVRLRSENEARLKFKGRGQRSSFQGNGPSCAGMWERTSWTSGPSGRVTSRDPCFCACIGEWRFPYGLAVGHRALPSC